MNRFKNILYVHEATADQASGIARAVSLAEGNQARLTLIEVVQPAGDPSNRGALAERRQALETMIELHRHRLTIQIDVLTGICFLEVIRAVLRRGHDLVIKVAESPDFLARLFGSQDMHLLRKCPCPVWLLKPSEPDRYRSILAAVDFDPWRPGPEEEPLNRQIVAMAGSLALMESASLHLVHAWEPIADTMLRSRGGDPDDEIDAYIERERMLHQNALSALGEELRQRVGKDAYARLSPSFHLLKGSAQRVIASLARELQADLVVMGTVARTGISGFFIGNTAESILGQLDCSVLAVKPPGFVTPVRLADASVSSP